MSSSCYSRAPRMCAVCVFVPLFVPLCAICCFPATSSSSTLAEIVGRAGLILNDVFGPLCATARYCIFCIIYYDDAFAHRN